MSLDAMKQALEVLESVVAAHGYNSGTPINAITALRAAIEQAQDPETELETYKRLYELRGKALERPCSNCGHQPAKIKAMAQPEQGPVFELGFGWLADATKYPRGTKLYATPPRQWQGLTDAEIKAPIQRAMQYFGYDPTQYSLGGAATIGFLGLVREIEAKLKEKNT